MRIEHTGSFVLFTPESAKDRKWIKKNVVTESWQWLGHSLAVDARFAADLAQGMKEAGIA